MASEESLMEQLRHCDHKYQTHVYAEVAARIAELEAAVPTNMQVAEAVKPRFYAPPFQFVEPTGGEGAMILDAKGMPVAMMMWPCHERADTEAAEQECYSVGRLFASTITASSTTEGDGE